jgi:hypothetical protein
MNKKLFLSGTFVSCDGGKTWQPCDYNIFFFTAINLKRGLDLKRKVPKDFMDSVFIRKNPATKHRFISALTSLKRRLFKD